MIIKKIGSRFTRYWELISQNDIWLSLAIASIFIVGALLIGWDNNQTMFVFPVAHYHYLSSNPLSYISNWDGPNYLWIAKHGYTNYFYASFFPLYPLLIRAFTYIFSSYLISALFISWLCFIGSIFFFIKILRTLGSLKVKDNGLSAAMFLVLFPTGVFLIATYTEALFALITLTAMYLTLKNKYSWLPILMLLVTLCHMTGVFVVALIALMLWEQKAKIRYILIEMAGGAIGVFAFMAYLKYRFNNVFAFISSQTHIHGWLSHNYFSLVAQTSIMNLVFIVLILTTTAYYWKKKKSFAIYPLLFLLIPLGGMQYGGFNRYVLMAFPVQFMLFEYFKQRKSAYPYALAAMAVIWTYTVLQYAGGYIGS